MEIPTRCSLLEDLERQYHRDYTFDAGTARTLAPLLAQLEGRIIALEDSLKLLLDPNRSIYDRRPIIDALRSEIRRLPDTRSPESVYQGAPPESTRTNIFKATIQRLLTF